MSYSVGLTTVRGFTLICAVILGYFSPSYKAAPYLTLVVIYLILPSIKV